MYERVRALQAPGVVDIDGHEALRASGWPGGGNAVGVDARQEGLDVVADEQSRDLRRQR